MSTINVTNLSGRGGATPNLPDGANITGVATATTFSGTLDGSLKTTGTPTLGLGVTINSSGLHVTGVTTVGVVTGGTFYGDGSNLTGVGESISPWHYNPDVNDVVVTPQTGIGITFNKKVLAGSGTATIKIVNAGVAGTTIQSWGVSSCTFDITSLTLGALVSDLLINQTYQLDIPEGFIVSSTGTNYAGTAYTFSVQDGVNKLWTTGVNDAGELGQNNRGVAQSSPVQIPGTKWTDSTPNTGNGYGHKNLHQIYLKDDGTLWAWGNAGNGQLGLNATVQTSSPTQIGADTTWNYTSRGYYNGFAKKTDGTLWNWGFNDYGQLGQNNTTQYSSPKQVPGTTWGDIQGGYYHTLALKTDNTLWAWGQNNSGALGQNQAFAQLAAVSSPIQIPGTTWSTITAGYHTSFATKTDGTLWSWGRDADGNLGQNTTDATNLSSPTQIPGTTWSRVEAGINSNYAIKTDGTLWVWGHGGNGALGKNSQTQYSSPNQLPGSWSQVSSTSYGAAAIKTDGTAWAWGSNDEGQVGQNNTTQYSSPAQIGSGTDFTSVSTCQKNVYLLERDTTP